MRRNRAQGRGAKGGVREGRGGANKRKKPPNICRGEEESGGELGGRSKKCRRAMNSVSLRRYGHYFKQSTVQSVKVGQLN